MPLEGHKAVSREHAWIRYNFGTGERRLLRRQLLPVSAASCSCMLQCAVAVWYAVVCLRHRPARVRVQLAHVCRPAAPTAAEVAFVRCEPTCRRSTVGPLCAAEQFELEVLGKNGVRVRWLGISGCHGAGSRPALQPARLPARNIAVLPGCKESHASSSVCAGIPYAAGEWRGVQARRCTRGAALAVAAGDWGGALVFWLWLAVGGWWVIDSVVWACSRPAVSVCASRGGTEIRLISMPCRTSLSTSCCPRSRKMWPLPAASASALAAAALAFRTSATRPTFDNRCMRPLFGVASHSLLCAGQPLLHARPHPLPASPPLLQACATATAPGACPQAHSHHY